MSINFWSSGGYTLGVVDQIAPWVERIYPIAEAVARYEIRSGTCLTISALEGVRKHINAPNPTDEEIEAAIVAAYVEMHG